MVLQNILLELEMAKAPVGKMLRKGTDFHVLGIGFKKHMILPEHKSSLPAKLVVIQGEVVYNSDAGPLILGLYDEHEIQVDQLHWIKANEDSMIIVVKGV